MKHKVYQLEDLDQQRLCEYVKLSVAKFEHLFGGRECATEFYYLYNFFSIASCNQETYNLYTQVVDCVRDYAELNGLPDEQVWLQSWINFHRQDDVLKSHSHDFPLHGYITLSNQKTDTVFTDGENGSELWRIENKPLQVYLGPGRIHHHVEVREDFDDERITLGFDVQMKDMISDNFSFIPIALC